MNKHENLSRRKFLGSSAVIGGTALGSASLPLSANAISKSAGKTKKVYKAPLFDPTLENYPGYSTYIPASISSQGTVGQSRDLPDPQLS